MYLSKWPICRAIIILIAALLTACRESGTGTVTEDAQLRVNSVNPIKGKFGTEITISGDGFSDTPSENELTINGSQAEILSSTPNSLQAIVPKGARTGPVSIRTAGKTATGPSFIYVPTIDVTTFAGSGQIGFRDGEGSQARFSYPVGLELTENDELLVVDHWNHSIRRITADGQVTTLAGDGEPGSRDGPGSRARFFRPTDVEVTGDGIIFVSDFGNHRIRHLTPSGSVTTLSGSTEGYKDGQPGVAQFSFPAGIALSENDTMFVSDSGNNRIRWVAPGGEAGTLAGSGMLGFKDGYVGEATFHFPFGMDFGSKGHIYIADYGNHSIRLVSSNNDVVSTFSGDGESGYINGKNNEARYNAPYDVAVDQYDRIYVADFDNHRIRRISPKRNAINIAGSGEPGLVNGDEDEAHFNNPIGLAINKEGNVLYVADHQNHVIRKVTIE